MRCPVPGDRAHILLALISRTAPLQARLGSLDIAQVAGVSTRQPIDYAIRTLKNRAPAIPLKNNYGAKQPNCGAPH